MLGIKCPPLAEKYGSATRATQTDLNICLDGRRGVLPEEMHPALEQLKVAAAGLEAEGIALLVTEFDKTAGITHLYDAHIMDPYYTAFGKQAEDELSKSPEGSIVVGNEYVTVASLESFVLKGFNSISSVFGPDMAKEKQKDPVGVFNSLPLPQKKMVIRMVNDNGPSEAISS